MVSVYGDSEWSESKIVLTKPTRKSLNTLGSTNAHLMVRGTGQNNHNASIIKINDIEILNRGDFIGLYLLVLKRSNLEKVYGGHYDTQNEQVSNELSNKIRSYNENYFIILVSCVAWEKHITETLVKTLTNCGAIRILEFYNSFRDKYSLETTAVDFSENNTDLISKYGRPYVFVGIPNIGTGNGFESLRTNIGYYLSIGNLPYAELVIRLTFNPYINMYVFHNVQLMNKRHYFDSIEMLMNAPDRSLRNLYEQLLDSNSTFRDNLQFVIYRNYDYTAPLYDTSSRLKQTEFDRIFLGDNVLASRYDRQNTEYIAGINPTTTEYYKFVNHFLEGNSCKPPYTNYEKENCIDLSKIDNKPWVIRCYVGIQPQNCPELPRIENEFTGINL